MTGRAGKGAKDVAESVANRADLVEATADQMKHLRRLISSCRSEGMQWNDIAKVLDVPAFCVRVIAGDIKKNRVSPEYKDKAPRR